MGRLTGKVALVTGGARGLGEAIVRSFVAEDAQVVFGDILDEEGEALAAELGDAASFVHMDVSQQADWDNAIAVAQTRGPLTVLVNNAAIVLMKALTDAAYSSTKWAVRGLTKNAAIELGQYGIRVNSVHPGGMWTAMGGKGSLSEEEMNKAVYANFPIPRVGQPEEVAAVILFLATDEASYSTGSEFVADGGWFAGMRNPMMPSS